MVLGPGVLSLRWNAKNPSVTMTPAVDDLADGPDGFPVHGDLFVIWVESSSGPTGTQRNDM